MTLKKKERRGKVGEERRLKKKTKEMWRETARLCTPLQKSRQRTVDTWSPRPWTREREREREREPAGIKKESDEGMRWMWLCVCVCVCVRVLSWEGVKARKQVPIVQRGSNEGSNEGLGFQSCPLQAHHGWARESRGDRGSRGGLVGINEERGAWSR